MSARAIALASLAGGAAILFWLAPGESDLRSRLALLAPVELQLCFLLMLGGGWAARRAIVRSFPEGRTVPVALAAASLALVALLPPRTHRIFYDEDIYQNVAQNMLFDGRAVMCNEGRLEHGTFECAAREHNKQPSAFPFLLSLLFRVTGVNEASAHALNGVLFSLATLLTYWIGSLLFSRAAGIAAALIYLFTPENLRWGATVAVEPGAAAFAGLSVALSLVFLREGSLSTGVAAAAALAFASQWRPESILIVAVAALSAAILRPRRWRRRELGTAALVLVVLLLPQLAHSWAVRDEPWGSTGERFAWSYVPSNLETNARFYVEGREYPPYFTLLAVLGLVGATRRREKIVVLAWLVAFFAVFLPFHAGSYRYGADVRFSLLCALPLALLAGAGAAELGGRLRARAAWAGPAPLLLAAYCFTGFLPFIRSVGREAWAARADHRAAAEMLAHVPADGIVLTHNPGMIQVLGRSAAQASLATYHPARVDQLFRSYPGGVYFHFSFWCNVPDPVQNAFCTTALVGFPNDVVLERSAGFYRFVLYRLMPRRDAVGPPTDGNEPKDP